MTKIQLRRGSFTEWTNENPVLSSGEIGFEIDTGKLKIGDGTKTWTALDYFDDQTGGGASNFDGLTDTPASKINQQGKLVRVDSLGSTLEYHTLTLDELGDVNESVQPLDGYVLKFDLSSQKWIPKIEEKTIPEVNDILNDKIVSQADNGKTLSAKAINGDTQKFTLPLISTITGDFSITINNSRGSSHQVDILSSSPDIVNRTYYLRINDQASVTLEKPKSGGAWIIRSRTFSRITGGGAGRP